MAALLVFTLGAGVGYAVATVRTALAVREASSRHTSAQSWRRYRRGLARTTARRLDSSGPRVAP
jgi:hypothetical protein